MDFLDPKKERRHQMLLLIGYAFIAVAIAIVVFLLLYVAYGFNFNRDGTVTQKGLLFVSSIPSGADIHLHPSGFTAALPANPRTNSRLSIPSGQYSMQITRQDYRPWQQTIDLFGGSIQHYDYPFLFPTKLATKPLKTYDTSPVLTTQSPDKRWLLVQLAGDTPSYEVYDLKNPKAPVSTIALPADLITAGTAQSWQVVEWAGDNQHVLLQHTYDAKTEFILLDRSAPDQSKNLNKTLDNTPTKLTLFNKKYDQYYAYDGSAQTLSTLTLNSPQPTLLLDHVLSYQTHGNNLILYVSSQAVTTGKVAINLWQSGKTYLLREAAANTTYPLELMQYSGDWYMVVGAASESRVYIYKNPQAQLQAKTGQAIPIFVLKTPNPNYVSFSNNARFIVDENGAQFAVYDNENQQYFSYSSKLSLDTPQLHASWMDGHRLAYVSGGKLTVFDFDGANPQQLMPANPNYLPAFDPSYKFSDVFTPASADGKLSLTTTSLRTPGDQ